MAWGAFPNRPHSGVLHACKVWSPFQESSILCSNRTLKISSNHRRYCSYIHLISVTWSRSLLLWSIFISVSICILLIQNGIGPWCNLLHVTCQKTSDVSLSKSTLLSWEGNRAFQYQFFFFLNGIQRNTCILDECMMTFWSIHSVPPALPGCVGSCKMYGATTPTRNVLSVLLI